MSFAIQLFNQPFERILNKLAVFSLFQHLPQRYEFRFLLLEQPQSGSNNLTRGGVTPGLQLLRNEGVEVLTKRNARVLAFTYASGSTNIWYCSPA